MFQHWLSEFAHDTKVHIAILLCVLDWLAGSASAWKTGTFRLSYTADILKNDVLGKLVPYLGFYILALVAGNEEWIPIPGVDFGALAGAAYIALVLALGASILNSLRELQKSPSQKNSIVNVIAGDENPS